MTDDIQKWRYHPLDGNQFVSPSQVTLSFEMQLLSFYSTPGMRSSCEVVVFINLKKALSGKYLKFQYDFFSIIVFALIIYRYLITVLHVQHFYQIKSTSFCVQAA